MEVASIHLRHQGLLERAEAAEQKTGLFIAFKKWVSNLPMKFLSYVYNKYSYNMGITTLRLQEQYYKHLSLAKEIRIAVGDVFLKA